MNGIMMSLSTTWIDIVDVTIENLPTRGVHFIPSGRIADSRVVDCTNTGVIYEHGIHGIVERSEFVNSLVYSTLSGGEKLTVRDCTFYGSVAGVQVNGHPSTDIIDCTFVDCNVAVACYGLAHLSVDRCTISGGFFGVRAENGLGTENVRISMSSIIGQQYSSIRLGRSGITGSHNILHSSGPYTIDGGNFTASFHNNHIIKGSTGLIKLNYYNIADQGLDFTNNWWSTSVADSITAWIYDSNDDPSIQAQVQYEPFSEHPLPAQQNSFSDLKRKYR